MQTFDLNAGEKGLLFSTRSPYGSDIWTAFYSEADYARGSVDYSDVFDLVKIANYQMDVDVRESAKRLRSTVRMDMQSTGDRLRAIPLALCESLPEQNSMRLKKNMRVQAARFADGTPLLAFQEDWEGGLSIVLPEARAASDEFSVLLELEGDVMYEPEFPRASFYPWLTTEWYPRHGYLARSTYYMTFRHKKRDSVASVGTLVSEGADTENKDESLTRWKIEQPVIFATFGVARFESHAETIETEWGTKLPLVFYSVPGNIQAIKEDFILAEMNNSVRYFSALFGAYSYPKFGGMFQPRGFGQGFPTLLLLPKADRASKYTYSFIAHETAHQWWGNIVGWRSYRDQWLSEGPNTLVSSTPPFATAQKPRVT